MEERERPSFTQVLWRTLRVRCPACGKGPLFRSFFLRVDRCSGCRRPYEREQGYWVGGSEIHAFASYGLSTLLFIPILILGSSSFAWQAAVIAGHLVFSVGLFRVSRALFLALDYWIDPDHPPEGGDDGGGGPPRPPRWPHWPPGRNRRYLAVSSRVPRAPRDPLMPREEPPRRRRRRKEPAGV